MSAPPPRARPRWRRWLGEAALVLARATAVGFWQTRHVPAGAAPAFAGRLAGAAVQTIALDEFRARHEGRAVILYFWAEWCPVCKLNEGAIDALRSDHPVLTVAMQSGDAAAVARHQATRGLAWETVVDDRGAIATRYGLSGVPAVIVLDAQGNIRFAEQGYTSGFGLRWRLWWVNRRPSAAPLRPGDR
jgi:thiol:disulfide interchange protein